MKPKTNEEIDEMIKDYIEDCCDDPNTTVSTTSDIYIDMSNASTMTMGNPSDYSDLIADDVIDMSGIFASSTNSTISITTDNEYDTTFDIYDTEKRLSAIEKRLAILEPRKDLLDKYEVLQSLYEQYKAAEAMLYEDEEEEELPF
jgi:hypothetical protein